MEVVESSKTVWSKVASGQVQPLPGEVLTTLSITMEQAGEREREIYRESQKERDNRRECIAWYGHGGSWNSAGRIGSIKQATLHT